MSSPSMPSRSKPRSRRTSLLSVSSIISLGPGFEVSKSRSTAGLSRLATAHEAYGSFVPVRSAASTLQDFASCVSPPISRPARRRRKVTFDDKCYYSPSWDDYEQPASSSSSQVPYITRTIHVTSSFEPSSPTSTSSSLSPPLSPIITPHDELHPILASLEEQSRLRALVIHCATCKKQGTDFPRCPKCGETWCSRSCRLVDGKRHVCSGRS